MFVKKVVRYSAFSKCFWGAGYKESRDGFGAKGTQASAQRAPAWHVPLGNFSNLDTDRCNVMQSGGFKVTKFHIWN